MSAGAPLGRAYRALVSAFILIVLGAQVATFGVTLWRPGWLTAKAYPIIEYPMYADPHYEGERIVARWLLRGVLPNGSTIDVDENSLHVSVWDFIHLTDPVALGQANTPQELKAEQSLVEVVREREPRAREFTSLRIDSYPMKLTRNGPAVAPSTTVVSIPMPSTGDHALAGSGGT